MNGNAYNWKVAPDKPSIDRPPTRDTPSVSPTCPSLLQSGVMSRRSKIVAARQPSPEARGSLWSGCNQLWQKPRVQGRARTGSSKTNNRHKQPSRLLPPCIRPHGNPPPCRGVDTHWSNREAFWRLANHLPVSPRASSFSIANVKRVHHYQRGRTSITG